jgi:glycosyltransferase involved in cell wall biosynthesis
MHIAFFTNTYRPVTSGVVRSVSSFRKGLADLGHNVFVFAQHASDYEDEDPFIFRYPSLELPVQDYPLTIPVSNFVERLLPSLKLDVIHAHHPVLLGQVAARKADEFDIPLVFTHHTRYRAYSHYVALPQDMVKEVIQRWLADYMQQCQHIVVPSDSIKEKLAERYGVRDRVTVVATGIDIEPFREADGRAVRRERGWEEDDVLISVGRLAEEKNWRTLLDAVQNVMQRRHNVRLIVLGDGVDRKKLEAYSRELGIGDRVEFVGLVPFEAVPRFLKAADLFCFASVSETQGLVTLEAMAAGLPVVAVDATGTADAVEHGVEGLLTANDSQALAQAIERVLEDKALREKFHQASEAKAQQFDNRVQAERLLEVYDRATADKKAGRTVAVDKQKPIFQINWQKLLGKDME